MPLAGEDLGDHTAGMVRLFPDMAPIPVPIWIVTHRELATNRRIGLVQDILAEHLSPA